MRVLIAFIVLVCAIHSHSQRNVILIIADDLGTDYCGFYEDHQDTAALPNIRRLLNKGVRFTNAMSNPVCSPTRAGILTGRYSFRTGVGDAVGGAGSGTIDTSEKTIPRLLKYHNPLINTANVGKWHLNLQTPAANLKIPNQMGYDYYEGNFLGALNSYTNWTKVTNGVSGTSANYATTETANDAIQWVKKLNDNPFFLWLAFNAPHTPLHLPPAGLHSYTSLSGTTADINAQPKAYFKASLEALDHEIGRLLDSLTLYGKMDSTDIIFIGDNGNGIRTSQNKITNRAKGTLYQYGISVPFIISGPSVANKGRISSALVNTHDLFPTIIELMRFANWSSQIPTSKPVDGKSILPILKNKSNEIRPWAFTEIFKVIPDSADGKAMRNLNYKLFHFDNGMEEFYNLSMDADESNNLLLNTLTNDDKTNYLYLCNEMTNLIGKGNFCSSIIGISQLGNVKPAVSIFPNPSNRLIHIKLENSNSDYWQVNFFDIRGQLIQKIVSTKQEEETYIDTSQLCAGSYLVNIVSNDFSVNQKVVITK
ncbi:MAG: sulfatase-like hydrolase/transferase [Bacteroidia bacterium]